MNILDRRTSPEPAFPRRNRNPEPAQRHEFPSPNYLISARTFGNLYKSYCSEFRVHAVLSLSALYGCFAVILVAKKDCRKVEHESVGSKCGGFIAHLDGLLLTIDSDHVQVFCYHQTSVKTAAHFLAQAFVH